MLLGICACFVLFYKINFVLSIKSATFARKLGNVASKYVKNIECLNYYSYYQY